MFTYTCRSEMLIKSKILSFVADIPSLGFLSVASTLPSVARISFRRFGSTFRRSDFFPSLCSSFRCFDSSFRRFDSSFRRSGSTFRRFVSSFHRSDFFRHFDSSFRRSDFFNVTSTLLSVALTLLSVASTLPSVALTLLSVASTLPSVALALPSVASTLLSIALALPSVTSTLLSVALALLFIVLEPLILKGLNFIKLAHSTKQSIPSLSELIHKVILLLNKCKCLLIDVHLLTNPHSLVFLLT